MPFTQIDANGIERVRQPPVWNVFKKEASLQFCQLGQDEIEEPAKVSIVQAFSQNASRVSVALEGGRTLIAVKKPKGELLENSPLFLQSTVFKREGKLLEFHPKASWIKHPALTSIPEDQLCDAVRKTWANGISYISEQRDQDGKIVRCGLRAPQIGALHAIAAHLTVSPQPSLVVMPTGTGKTEVMLATAIMRCPERLLVLVPSDALRTQTYNKFVRLGLLKKLTVVEAGVLNPVVGVLRKSVLHKNDLQNIEKCNVVVSTVAALQQTPADLLKQFCGLLTRYSSTKLTMFPLTLGSALQTFLPVRLWFNSLRRRFASTDSEFLVGLFTTSPYDSHKRKNIFEK